MATIDEFALKNIGLWWKYRISRHCDEWKYIIIGRIFESEIILIPPSLKISKSSSNGSYRNTDEVWLRYGISRSCDEWWYNNGRPSSKKRGIQSSRIRIGEIRYFFFCMLIFMCANAKFTGHNMYIFAHSLFRYQSGGTMCLTLH